MGMIRAMIREFSWPAVHFQRADAFTEQFTKLQPPVHRRSERRYSCSLTRQLCMNVYMVNFNNILTPGFKPDFIFSILDPKPDK